MLKSISPSLSTTDFRARVEKFLSIQVTTVIMRARRLIRSLSLSHKRSSPPHRQRMI